MVALPGSVGAILAGGKSLRFGSDKRVAVLGGIPLIERVRNSMAEAVEHLVVVTSAGSPLQGLEQPSIADAPPPRGPLSGIHAALAYAQTRGAPGALIVGCDTPFLPPALLAELVRRGTADVPIAIVAESAGRRQIEPLCGWYSCNALPAVEAALNASRLSPHALLAELSADHLPLDVVSRFGEPRHMFRNLNTPGELAEAEVMLNAEPLPSSALIHQNPSSKRG